MGDGGGEGADADAISPNIIGIIIFGASATTDIGREDERVEGGRRTFYLRGKGGGLIALDGGAGTCSDVILTDGHQHGAATGLPEREGGAGASQDGWRPAGQACSLA